MREITVGKRLIDYDSCGRVCAVLIGDEAASVQLQAEGGEVAGSDRRYSSRRNITGFRSGPAFEKHFRGVVIETKRNVLARASRSHLRQSRNTLHQTIIKTRYLARIGIGGIRQSNLGYQHMRGLQTEGHIIDFIHTLDHT